MAASSRVGLVFRIMTGQSSSILSAGPIHQPRKHNLSWREPFDQNQIPPHLIVRSLNKPQE
jgi:hypothetical protein